MDVALISPYSDIAAMGLRLISAMLKRSGHRTRMIFLPYQFPEIEYRRDFMQQYSQEILEQVEHLCRGAGLIGFSLMTNYFEQVATLTTYLKEKLGTPVIWGGIHATLRPEECLDYADMVCIGEGEFAILDVVRHLERGKDIVDVPNIAVRSNGSVRKNPPRPIIEDLDSLPFFDYDMDDHHVLNQEQGRIIPLNRELLKEYLTRKAPTKARAALFYQTIASRGCPHHCTYCCWDALKRVYPKTPPIRRRSTAHVMEELGSILDSMPWFREITFSDDSFLDAPIDEIETFAAAYKKVVGRPFQCLAEPRTVTRNRLDPMVDAGLANIQIGIQTGSERIKKMYRRENRNERLIAMARLLREYVPRIRPPIYDFILDNPWETLEDKRQTLQLLMRFPPPFYLQIFRLTFFPGTALFDKALEEGLITGDIRDIYRQQYNMREITYVNMLFSLFSRPVPRYVLRVLISRPAITLFSNGAVNRLLKTLYGAYRHGAVRRRERREGIPSGKAIGAGH